MDCISMSGLKLSEDETNFISNPLEIPDILEFVFRHLDLSQLLNCRFVCKLWKAEATTALRKIQNQKPIFILDPHDLDKFIEMFRESKVITNSLQVITSSTCYFDHYDKLVSIIGPTTLSVKLNDQFIERMGCTFLTITAYKMMPNILYRIIFKDFPNLAYLELCDSVLAENFESEFTNIMDQMKNSNQRAQLHSLKTLSFEFVLREIKTEMEIPLNGNFLSIYQILLKISPNLNKVIVASLPHIYLIQRIFAIKNILESIGKFSPMVKILCFRARGFSTISNSIPIDIKNLQLKELSFENIKLEWRESYDKDFIYSIYPSIAQTPLTGTLENLTMKFKTRPEPSKYINIHRFLPFQFINLKKIVLEFDEPKPLAKNFILKLSNICPQIEELVTKNITIRLNLKNEVVAMANLKRISFVNTKFYWRNHNDAILYLISIIDFAPNLFDLELSMEIEGDSNECGILIYPLIIFVVENWLRIPKFRFTFNKSLSWTKGCPEHHLGISSVAQLTNENGHFTTREITKLDFSLVIKSIDLFLTGGKRLYDWILANLPKHERVKEIELSKDPNSAELAKILTQIYS